MFHSALVEFKFDLAQLFGSLRRVGSSIQTLNRCGTDTRGNSVAVAQQRIRNSVPRQAIH